MERNASPLDILKAYYFVRLLDRNMLKFEKQENSSYNLDIIRKAKEQTEKEFQEVDFEKFVTELES